MEYERVVSLDLTDLVPQVAVPPRPDLVTIVPASQEVYRAAAREGPFAGDRGGLRPRRRDHGPPGVRQGAGGRPGSILTTKETRR